jgi:hypothetical protein
VCCYPSFSDNSERFGEEFKNLDTVVHREMRELVANSYHWMEGYSRIWTRSVTFPEKLNLPHNRSAAAPGCFETKSEARAASFTTIPQLIPALRMWTLLGLTDFCGS